MKNNLVVIEGPDNVGKTAIAKSLANELGYNYLHFGKPDPEMPWGYQYAEISAGFCSYVLDRSWISGIFYDYYRREDAKVAKELLTYAYMGLMALMHERFNVTYLFVERDWSDTVEAHIAEIEAGTTNIIGGTTLHFAKSEGTHKVLSLAEREVEHKNFTIRCPVFSPFIPTMLNTRNVGTVYNYDSIEAAVESAIAALNEKVI